MIKICVLLSLILLLLFFCEQTPQSNTAQFHSNIKIHYIIKKFNQVSSEKVPLIKERFSYQVFFSLKDAHIRISSNDNHSFIDISAEIHKQNYFKIKEYANLFIKSLLRAEISADELKTIHKELLTGKYQFYDKYTYKDIQLGLSTTKLSNGKYRYKLDIKVPNSIVLTE